MLAQAASVSAGLTGALDATSGKNVPGLGGALNHGEQPPELVMLVDMNIKALELASLVLGE